VHASAADAPSADTPSAGPSAVQSPTAVAAERRAQSTAAESSLHVPAPQEPRADAPDAATPVASDQSDSPFAFVTEADSASNRLLDLNRRRRKERRRAAFVLGVALLLVAGGLGFVLIRRVGVAVPAAEGQPPARVASAAAAVVPDRTPANIAPTFESDSPTQGEPIRLFMVPSGARLLVHLRPADLWSDKAPYVELRASLTQNLITAMEGALRDISGCEPRDLEEVLLAWILGARGTEPQIAAVVHLADEDRLTEVLQEFGGQPADADAAPTVLLRGDRAVLIRDRRTLAFAPRELAAEMAEWCDAPNHNTSDGVLALLEQTDRQRLLTVVFDPSEVQRQRDDLFAAPVRDVAGLVASWFAEHAETVGWSIHTGDEFFSEVLLRPRSVQSSSTTLERVTESLEEVPAHMLAGVRQLNPQRVGFRRLIGRFPAMLEASRRATVGGIGPRTVRLATALPTKAGPNLALAAVLTWDEWTGRRPESAREQEAAPLESGVAPQSVEERLQLPVDVEFTRTPLHEAVAYIAGEIDVPIDIDGDALKEAGYTKNMPQTFTLGKVSAAAALQRILQPYQEPGKEMVLVVDEQQQRATILTRPFAERRGLTPHPLQPGQAESALNPSNPAAENRDR
jgi:hypothetical protein